MCITPVKAFNPVLPPHPAQDTFTVWEGPGGKVANRLLISHSLASALESDRITDPVRSVRAPQVGQIGTAQSLSGCGVLVPRAAVHLGEKRRRGASLACRFGRSTFLSRSRIRTRL